MLSRQGYEWLCDDWNEAVHRSLVARFTRQQVRALQVQHWLGRGARWSLLALPLLLLLSVLFPAADGRLLRGLLAWSVEELVLIVAHLLLGFRYGVSYSWAFHSARPLLLQALGAYRDLKLKALLAVALAVLVALLVSALLGQAAPH